MSTVDQDDAFIREIIAELDKEKLVPVLAKLVGYDPAECETAEQYVDGLVSQYRKPCGSYALERFISQVQMVEREIGTTILRYDD